MTSLPPPLVDDWIPLPGGRRLAYACYGAAAGRPLYLLHGWPGSRLGGAPLAAAAKDAGVTLVAPDRPGLGGSDPLPGRTLLGWADDLAALADHLGHERFALVGFSGGAPFALAAIHRLADRLLTRASDGGPAAAVVSGQVPLADPGARALMPPQVQAVLALHRHVPLATRLSLGLLAMGLQLAPDLFVQQLRLGLPAVDRRVLDRPGLGDALGAEYREALRQGAEGITHEMSLYASPWGFELGTLPPGLLLYHGEEDANVPVALARRQAAALPSPVTRFLPGAGHLWLLAKGAELFAALA